MMDGVIYYAAGELPFFELDTAIQPDNPHPIRHGDIAASNIAGTFELLGQMPEDFKDRLIAAVNASVTLAPARKRNILQRL